MNKEDNPYLTFVEDETESSLDRLMFMRNCMERTLKYPDHPLFEYNKQDLAYINEAIEKRLKWYLDKHWKTLPSSQNCP